MTFLIQQTLIYAVPLMIVALAGVFAERSGIINLALEGIMIFGAFIGVWFIRIMQGTGGPFVSMPSYKTGEGYRDICFPCTAAFHRQFHDTVINAYQQALAQSSQRQNVPAHGTQPPAPSFEGQTM